MHERRELGDEVEVVLDEEEGDAVLAVQPRDGRRDLAQEGAVDPRRRLVEQDHARARHQRAAELHQLLLPARERGRGRLGMAGGVEALQHRHRPAAQRALLRGEAAAEQPGRGQALAALARLGDHQVLQHRHPPEQARDLEGAGETHRVQPPGRQAGDVLAAEEHAPAVGAQEARDGGERRALARPVRPDEAGDGALRHREGHAGERGEAAEALLHALQLEGVVAGPIHAFGDWTGGVHSANWATAVTRPSRTAQCSTRPCASPVALNSTGPEAPS